MKLSDLSDDEWFKRLSARHLAQQTPIRDWWSYYDGEQPLYYLLRILADQDDRFGALTINWCRKFVNTVERRLTIESFKLGGNDSPDEVLQDIWERNDMDAHQASNAVASLVTGSSYIMVGPSDEGALVTVESPASVSIEVDPRTRRTIAALKFYKSDSEATTDDRAVLQIPLPDGQGSKLVEFENGKPVDSSKQKWMSAAQRLQSSPEVPVVRFLNQQRPDGRHFSELVDLKPIVDSANFVATSMMATVLHHAMPRMLAINVAESLFMNKDGSVNREAVKNATGALWIVPAETDDRGNVPPNAPVPDIKQLPASDLRNFHETLGTLARVGSGLCDISPHTFGFGVADNPASADGIRASEGELVARVERLQKTLGVGYSRVMRLALAVEGRDISASDKLRPDWRSASTPTQAAKADAAVKTYGAGVSDLHQARVDYGYSATTIKAMEDRERDAASDPELADAVNELRAARDAAVNGVTGDSARRA